MSQLENSLVKVGTLLFLTQSPQVLLMAVKCHHPLHRDPRASCSKARWTLPVCVAVPSDHSPACSGPTRPLVTSGSLDPWLPAGCGSWEPQQLLRGREESQGKHGVPSCVPPLLVTCSVGLVTTASPAPQVRMTIAPHCHPESLPSLAGSRKPTHNSVNSPFNTLRSPAKGQNTCFHLLRADYVSGMSSALYCLRDSFHALNDLARKRIVPIS